MSQSNLSAGEPGAPRCSEEATASQENDDLAALTYGAVFHNARRIRLLAEAMGAQLDQFAGCQIDRIDMVLAMRMLEELANTVLSDLPAMRPTGYEEPLP